MDLVRQAIEWARAQALPALPIEAVPGTSDSERRSLAALGGIAGALAKGRLEGWPSAMRAWVTSSSQPPSEITESIRRELVGGRDVLALLYEGLVSGRNRRRLGTFFTPPAVVDFMLDRAESMVSAPAVVIDPGAGVGAFSLAARRRWPDAEVVAVDVNLVTLGLLAAHPAAKVSLVHDDYLRWTLGPTVPTTRPRLWIGNPPYTRHQQLTVEFKQMARKASGDLVKSGLAGLSAYFLATTLRALGQEDVLCFLLPGSWTDAHYGRPLRSALRDLLGRPVEFFGFHSDVDVFPGTRVTAMVTVVGPVRASATALLSTATARLEPGGVAVGRSVSRDRSDGAIDGLGTWLWRRGSSQVKDGVPLRELATVRRGVATGANEFFLLTDAASRPLPGRVLVPAVRRLRHIAGERLTPDWHARLGALGERRWLLRITDPSGIGQPAIEQWMLAAKAAGVDKRYLPSHREPWYAVEAMDPPDIIVSPMGKGRMRAVVNEAKAIPANSLYGLYVQGDTQLVARITAWLNTRDGQVGLLERARAYGAGLFKLEPNDLLAVRVPREVVRHEDRTTPDAQPRVRPVCGGGGHHPPAGRPPQLRMNPDLAIGGELLKW